MVIPKKYLDLAERVVLTFVGAFAAIYIAAYSSGTADIAVFLDPGLLNKALTAGIAALVPLVSGLIGFRVGDKSSPSMMPAKPETQISLDKDVPMESPAPIYINEG